jgi:hypothetical protein
MLRGIVINGSVGFHNFVCMVCKTEKLEVKQSTEVVEAFLYGRGLACEECKNHEEGKTNKTS